MAVFKIAAEKTGGYEGGYVFDPDDKGGETFNGISRVHHPNWQGWKVIDELKKLPNFEEVIDNNSQLKEWEEYFFEEEYWNVIPGIGEMSQELANEIYDNNVNMGKYKSFSIWQEALNLLNRNEMDYPDIGVDGNFGRNSFNAYKACMEKGKAKLLLKVINGLQFEHYVNCMRKNPTNEKYIGWFNRVEIIN